MSTDVKKHAQTAETDGGNIAQIRSSYMNKTGWGQKLSSIGQFLGFLSSIGTSFALMSVGSIAGPAMAKAGIMAGITAVTASPLAMGLVIGAVTMVAAGIALNYYSSRIMQESGFDMCDFSAERNATQLAKKIGHEIDVALDKKQDHEPYPHNTRADGKEWRHIVRREAPVPELSEAHPAAAAATR